MGKIVKTSKVLSAIYNKQMRDKLRIKDSILAGPLVDVGLVFSSTGEGAYTYATKVSNYRLVIGGKLISQIAKLPDSFADKESCLSYYDDIIMAFYGLNYHEMGHIKFTDMKDTSISEYPAEKYRGFLHQLFNILEDPIEEASMSVLFSTKYPHEINPKIFFDFMKERIFDPQAAKYTDHGSIGDFMNYLLLLLRCGKGAIKGTNKVFTKYESDLLPLIGAVLYEEDGTERIHKTVTLGEWIIENIKEFEWEELEAPEHPTSGIEGGMPGGEGEGGAPMKAKGGAKVPGAGDVGGSEPGKSEEGGHDTPGGGGGEAPEIGHGEKSSDISESRDDVDGGGEEGSESAGDPGRDKIEEDAREIEEEMDDVFIDTFRDGSDHEWLIAKDVYEVVNPAVNDKIDQRIEKFKDSINEVSKFLKLFQGRCKPRRVGGFTRGRLNVFRAMQDDIKNDCDTKLFTQEVKRGKDADLVVSLVIDNSGSMSGKKSILASQAALVLAQACDWTGIPFECQCFTKTVDCSSGTSITIVQKSFEDDFQKSKPYFAITDSDLDGALHSEHPLSHFTFCGNSDEINLYYIWKKFQKVEHRTKLMFVMSDGCTTGSITDLKRVVKEISEDGIIVIGIGICDNTVASSYPIHKVFNSTTDLERGLADYLVDTLSKYAV